MRLRFVFWLNLEKPEEYAIAEQIEDLKEKRSFAATIRNGIRLMQDLAAGRVDVLQELFPWVFDTIYAAAEADILAKQAPQQTEPQNDLVLEQLARLEAHMEKLGALPITQGIPSKAPIPLAPPDDDFEIEVKQIEGAGGNAKNNFLKSITALAGVNFHDEQKTPPAPRKSRATTRKTTAEPAAPKGIKTLAVQQFAPPSFDDDDDGISLFT